MGAEVTITGIQKSFGARMVLDIPALHLEPGLKYALIGPNGSGKSTLLRVLSGVLAPDAGSIATDAKEIGYMPQKPYCFGFSTCKNVELAVEDRPDAHQLALRALARVGMEAHAETRGSRLSGGEAQRMAFARMIVKRRDLLLLDEPTSATDVAGSILLEDALLSYSHDVGCTVLFATHTPSVAARCADRVILLCNGRVCEWGEAKQVLLAPQSEEAKSFLTYWKL
ncbi:MAG: ATP-binding cassette domain-containing protein [Clostridia bacterium]|nr:ATP-binding cassette domain-containing protein [Clostridia bacterium]